MLRVGGEDFEPLTDIACGRAVNGLKAGGAVRVNGRLT